MTLITEFPDLDSLTQRVVVGFEGTKEEAKEEFPDRAESIDELTVVQMVVFGDWANDRAEPGEDQLDIVMFVDDGSGNPQSTIPQFSRIANFMADEMVNFIEASGEMMEWFPVFSREVVGVGNFDDVMGSRIDVVDVEGDVAENAYELLTETWYTLAPTEPFGYEVVQTTAEEAIQEEEEQIPPPIGEAETAQPEVPEPGEQPEPTQIEKLQQQFSDVPVELLPYAIKDGEVEIPAGKETYRVEARDPYPFEEEMYTPGDARTEIREVIQDGIGESIAAGMFGEQDPPSNFPDTSGYIKNYLRFVQSQYALQMYRDLVIYTGYISRIHEGDFRAGEYNSFRMMLNRLAMAEDEGGPNLLRKIPADEAVERGFDIQPDHPKKDGEKATWLQNRQYYEIKEDKLDHPAWDDVTEWIYD